MDILAALEDASPTRGAGRCNVMKWLDAIPEDTPGRDELIRLFETKHDPKGDVETRSAKSVARLLTSLGYTVQEHPIHDHRNGDCACFR